MKKDHFESIFPLDAARSPGVERIAGIFSARQVIERRAQVLARHTLYLAARRGAGFGRLTKKEKEFFGSLLPLAEIALTGIAGMQRKMPGSEVKSVKFYLREQLRANEMERCLELVQYGVSGREIESLSHALMLSDAAGGVLYPLLAEAKPALAQHRALNERAPHLAGQFSVLLGEFCGHTIPVRLEPEKNADPAAAKLLRGFIAQLNRGRRFKLAERGRNNSRVHLFATLAGMNALLANAAPRMLERDECAETVFDLSVANSILSAITAAEGAQERYCRAALRNYGTALAYCAAALDLILARPRAD
ncbi:MAG: hypothetical protein PHW69_06310 [Elusimicrobiaceae bacterium]|nr:hypothetical protein [Elusimicrobiaceae bacterium]